MSDKYINDWKDIHYGCGVRLKEHLGTQSSAAIPPAQAGQQRHMVIEL